MNLKRNKLLHYLLIILMMIAPLRSVMAMQQVDCDGHAETMSEVVSHDMHAAHDMSSMTSPDSSHQAMQTALNMDGLIDGLVDRQCCCCDGDACSSDCDMGMTVSLFIQVSNFAPLFLNVAEAENISAGPIVRELTPPSRPPANLS